MQLRFRPGLAAVGVPLQVDALVLERSPDMFDEDFIHSAAASVHGDPDSGGREHASERDAGEPDALVGVVATSFASR